MGTTRRLALVPWRRGGGAFAVGVASVSAVGFVAYLASILNGDFNTNDDTLCYFGFVREILDRGTLSQPFSFRRESVYGGQQLLQAMQIAIPVPDTHLHLLDHGMALLTVMALLVGHARASRGTSRAILLLALLHREPPGDPREHRGRDERRGLLPRPVPDAHVAAREGRSRRPSRRRSRGASCGRRVRAPAELPCADRHPPRLRVRRPIVQGMRLRPLHIQREPIVRAAVTGATMVIFLSPWWAMAQRWCRTFLFPIIAGNYNPDYDFFKPLTLFEELKYVWANVTYCLPVKAVPFFLVAALTSIDRKRSRTLVHFAIATFAGVAMLIQRYPDVDAPTCARYYFGFTFAALLAIAIEVGSSSPRRASARGRADAAMGLPLIAIAIAVQLYADREQTTKTFDGYLSTIQKEWEHPTSQWKRPTPTRRTAAAGGRAGGAPIAVMVDQYDRFDLRRNEVQSLDMIRHQPAARRCRCTGRPTTSRTTSSTRATVTSSSCTRTWPTTSTGATSGRSCSAIRSPCGSGPRASRCGPSTCSTSFARRACISPIRGR